jgi:hypothetical protein
MQRDGGCFGEAGRSNFCAQTSRMFSARNTSVMEWLPTCRIFLAGRRCCRRRCTTPGPIILSSTMAAIKLDLRVVEIKPGAQPDAMFDETKDLKK